MQANRQEQKEEEKGRRKHCKSQKQAPAITNILAVDELFGAESADDVAVMDGNEKGDRDWADPDVAGKGKQRINNLTKIHKIANIRYGVADRPPSAIATAGLQDFGIIS